MTLKLMRQATANPAISALEYFNGKFKYNATPLGPLGISVIVHTKKDADNHGTPVVKMAEV